MPIHRTAMVLAVLALLVGLGVSQVRRDTVPPELFVEVAEQIPSGLPFELFVSANEPVRFVISYGPLLVEEVSQELRASLLAQEGEVPLQIRAEDGAGNVTTVEIELLGIAPPLLELHAPAALLPGDPLALRLVWHERGAAVVSRSLSADGAPLALHGADPEPFALTSVPLGSEPGRIALQASVEDEFGRRVEAVAEVTVLPDPQPVEELNLSPAVLSVSTPEGRELEARMFNEAYANPLPDPLWTEPFLLPIEGLGTSGFGAPRRYAPGGRVSYHFGSDIAAPAGTPVLATNAGVVLVADFFPIKGGLVIIDHGAGVTSLYFHQSRILVAAGERIERGRIIGEVGSTGLSSGPHLHWEMRVAARPTDPLVWVDRVLPLAARAVGGDGGDPDAP